MCKACNKCGVTYDNMEESFYKRNNKFIATCKNCERLRIKMRQKKPEVIEWNNKNKDKRTLYFKEYKKTNTNKIRIKAKDDINNLSTYYIKRLLKASKTTYIENPTVEIIEAYRQLIILKREKLNFIKTLKKELKIK